MSDPLSPQWEDCKVCGGDHWTKDHHLNEPTTAAGRALLVNLTYGGDPSRYIPGERHQTAILAIEAEARAPYRETVRWLVSLIDDGRVDDLDPLDDYVTAVRKLQSECPKCNLGPDRHTKHHALSDEDDGSDDFDFAELGGEG